MTEYVGRHRLPDDDRHRHGDTDTLRLKITRRARDLFTAHGYPPVYGNDQLFTHDNHTPMHDKENHR